MAPLLRGRSGTLLCPEEAEADFSENYSCWSGLLVWSPQDAVMSQAAMARSIGRTQATSEIARVAIEAK